MAEIKGIVTNVQGERAQVKVDKTQSTIKNLPKYLDCWNPVNAKAGNIVGIEYQELEKRKVQAIIYGLPVIGFLAGGAFGNGIAVFFRWEKLPCIAVGIIIWFLLALSYTRIFKRDAVRSGSQPVIIEIEVPKMVIDTSNNPENN
ncbi:MAG: SoxR reducing system RseC family protein [Phascolarctobacterium sp.]|nr:SoxR reducing system RseC family protein [Phascolarctobacterium sp.]